MHPMRSKPRRSDAASSATAGGGASKRGASVLQLSRIVGHWVGGMGSVGCTADGHLAFPAGAAVVVHDWRRDSHVTILKARKAVGCVATHPSLGNILASSESSGSVNRVVVWDTKQHAEVVTIRRHKKPISSLCFSSGDGQYLITCGGGDEVFVWNWRASSSAPVQDYTLPSPFSLITPMAPATPGFIVSGQEGLLKALPYNCARDRDKMPRYNLKTFATKNFVAVGCCGTGVGGTYTYVVAEDSPIVEIDKKGSAAKWVYGLTAADRQSGVVVTAATIGAQHICIGASDGKVNVFNTTNLAFLCKVPAAGSGPSPYAAAANPVSALVLDGSAKAYLHVFYMDKSTVHLELATDVSKAGVVSKVRPLHLTSRSLHGTAVWGMAVARAGTSASSLVTCSEDGKVQIWRLSSSSSSTDGAQAAAASDGSPTVRTLSLPACVQEYYRQQEKDAGPLAGQAMHLRTLACSDDLSFLVAGDRYGNVYIFHAAAKGGAAAGSDGYVEPLRLSSMVEAHDGEVLSLFVFSSPTLSLLASGGRDGCVHLWELRPSAEGAGLTRLLHTVSHHVNAVTSVYIKEDSAAAPASTAAAPSSSSSTSASAAAAATADAGGAPSSSSSSSSAPLPAEKRFLLVTTGADGKVALQRFSKESGGVAGGFYEFHPDPVVKSGTAPVLGAHVHPKETFLLTVGKSDLLTFRQLSLNGSVGQVRRQYTVLSDGGGHYLVRMDPTGAYIAVGSCDGSVKVIDFFSGSVLAQTPASGAQPTTMAWVLSGSQQRHADPVAAAGGGGTGAGALGQKLQLVIGDAEGCITVWRLSVSAANKLLNTKVDTVEAQAVPMMPPPSAASQARPPPPSAQAQRQGELERRRSERSAAAAEAAAQGVLAEVAAAAAAAAAAASAEAAAAAAAGSPERGGAEEMDEATRSRLFSSGVLRGAVGGRWHNQAYQAFIEDKADFPQLDAMSSTVCSSAYGGAGGAVPTAAAAAAAAAAARGDSDVDDEDLVCAEVGSPNEEETAAEEDQSLTKRSITASQHIQSLWSSSGRGGGGGGSDDQDERSAGGGSQMNTLRKSLTSQWKLQSLGGTSSSVSTTLRRAGSSGGGGGGGGSDDEGSGACDPHPSVSSFPPSLAEVHRVAEDSAAAAAAAQAASEAAAAAAAAALRRVEEEEEGVRARVAAEMERDVGASGREWAWRVRAAGFEECELDGRARLVHLEDERRGRGVLSLRRGAVEAAEAEGRRVVVAGEAEAAAVGVASERVERGRAEAAAAAAAAATLERAEEEREAAQQVRLAAYRQQRAAAAASVAAAAGEGAESLAASTNSTTVADRLKAEREAWRSSRSGKTAAATDGGYDDVCGVSPARLTRDVAYPRSCKQGLDRMVEGMHMMCESVGLDMLPTPAVPHAATSSSSAASSMASLSASLRASAASIDSTGSVALPARHHVPEEDATSVLLWMRSTIDGLLEQQPTAVGGGGGGGGAVDPLALTSTPSSAGCSQETAMSAALEDRLHVMESQLAERLGRRMSAEMQELKDLLATKRERA